MLFSEKCADPHEKSYYACGNSSRPSLFAKNPLLGETELLQDFKSGCKLRHIPNTYRRVPFVLNCCMLSNVFLS